MGSTLTLMGFDFSPCLSGAIGTIGVARSAIKVHGR